MKDVTGSFITIVMVVFIISSWIRGIYVLAQQQDTFWAIMAFAIPPYGLFEGIISYF